MQNADLCFKTLTELADLANTEDVVVYCENEGEKKRFEELLDQATDFR